MNTAAGIARLICCVTAWCGILQLCGCEDPSTVDSTEPGSAQRQTQNKEPQGDHVTAQQAEAKLPNDSGLVGTGAGNDEIKDDKSEEGDGSQVETKDNAAGQSEQGDQQDKQSDDAQSDHQDQEHGRAEIDWDAPIKQPPEAEGMAAPFEKADVWVDLEKKKIVMAGRVCQSAGFLEFFATLRGYQEHEAIVTVRTKSSFIHGLLLAIGVEPGRPVQYRPEFRAAEGPEINVTVYWTDKDGKRQSAKAQDWIRNAETGKAMEHPFVFAGSKFVSTGEGQPEHYTADDGYLICVSNFPTAMLDLPIASTDSNARLMFEAFEGRVPAVGTEITVVLEPKDKPADKGDADASKGGADKSASAGDDG
ncbi:MAG: YdjY domain-containing protein [Pirellulales bacterium]|nr:YdjY domain-containing protein [Pirellulales bacterium]